MSHRHFHLLQSRAPATGDLQLDLIASMLYRLPAGERPVRLTFFGPATDSMSFHRHDALIQQAMTLHFGAVQPCCSYVAQKPLDCDGDLLLEVQTVPPDTPVRYGAVHGTRYLVLEDGPRKWLSVGNIRSADISASMALQAAGCFARLQAVLESEGMGIADIVRQWNYLEHITAYDGPVQRYQAFNEVRTACYDTAAWPEGYPAATGIGTAAGGLLIEADAMTDASGCRCSWPIDNSRQVPAHAYSQHVLEHGGRALRSTPKFERARLLATDGTPLLAISGTAAIRGEQSMGTADADAETRCTLDHIAHLMQQAARRCGVPADLCETSPDGLQLVRAYVKRAADAASIRACLSNRYPSLPCAFLQADICREELLVEIEGWALVKARCLPCGHAGACPD